MNVIILAAGYGTRLQNDIINDKTGKYSNLLDVPKPLLPIKNDQPLLSLWMEIINEVDIINKVYIVINRKYEDQFRLWAKDHPNIILVVENSCSNEDRSGAVKCIQLALDSMEELTDVNVLAGDTLFMKDFSLSKAICLFKNISGNKDISLISYYNCSDNDVSKRGILEVDDSGHVLQFLEKPKPSVTTSRKAHEDISKRDAPGNFIPFLIEREEVNAFEIGGRFDVGGLESYIHCRDYFTNR